MERNGGGGWTGFSDEDLRKLKQSAGTGQSSGNYFNFNLNIYYAKIKLIRTILV